MLKTKLKHVVYRLMRPGLQEVHERLERLEGLTGQASGGTWRGGLEGHPIGADRSIATTLARKYHGELAYWNRMIKVEAESSLGGPFQEVLRGWQVQRMAALGECLGLQGEEAFHDWTRERSVVDIGAGPFPSISVVPWRRAVAVDPIADGYSAEGLLPDECDRIIYVTAPGECVPLPSASADLVVIENALDHVSEPSRVVSEIHRLLVRDGLLWILVDLMEHRDELHPHPFTEESIRALLHDHGFEVVKDWTSDHKSHPEAWGEYRGLLRKRPHEPRSA
jgi:SAM-dependent methyltransferase